MSPVTAVEIFVPPAIVSVSEFVLLANEPESDVNVLTIFWLLPKSELVNVITFADSLTVIPVPPTTFTKLWYVVAPTVLEPPYTDVPLAPVDYIEPETPLFVKGYDVPLITP